MPMVPVAQKRHAAAQPTWLDTHSVERPLATRRITASVSSPSEVRKSSLLAPSCVES